MSSHTSDLQLGPGADIELVADIKGGKGNADALFITEIPKPRPRKSDAIVKVKAFGLNRMDLLQREGQYPVPPQAPKTLGVEFSGVIESFGGGAEDSFKVGDEVFGLAYGGSCCNVPEMMRRTGDLAKAAQEHMRSI